MKRVAISWNISFDNASYKCPLMERTTKPCWWKETSISLSGKKCFGINNLFRLGQSQDWIVEPGYSFVVFSTSHFAPPTLSSVDPKKRNITDRGIHVLISSMCLRISFHNCYFFHINYNMFLVKKFLKHIDKDHWLGSQLTFMNSFRKWLFFVTLFRHSQRGPCRIPGFSKI